MRIGIIGGGPGGAVTAAVLAQGGAEVHVFEREVFPRFHIGESLLPTNEPILASIGLTPEVLRREGFVPKRAAHFEDAASDRWVRFRFDQGLPGDPPGIVQVERARFDHLLLQTASRLGAQVHQPVLVTHVDLTQRLIRHSHGEDRFDFIIDASGRDTFLGRMLGIVDTVGDLKRAAVFGHLGRLPLAPGAEFGDITIAKADAGWCWQIPITPERWSVGLVLKREFVQGGGSPAAVFDRHLSLFPRVAQRIGSQRPAQVHTIPNISYQVRERLGPTYALIGDAGGFIDPIFSSGVLLATRAGFSLARLLLAHGPRADLIAWKTATDYDLAVFLAFIRLWYDGHFISNLFFAPDPDPEIARGIVSLLAGNTSHPMNRFLPMLRSRMAANTGS